MLQLTKPELTKSEVVEHILTTMRAMTIRPRMYSSTPAAMEETLAALDKVRELLVIGVTDKLPSYTRFLIDLGHGSGSYCFRMGELHADWTDDRLFEEVSRCWTEYLNKIATTDSSG